MTAAYWELAVAVPPDAAEPVTNFLWELGALGVVEEEMPGASPRLRAFFPAHADAPQLATRLSAYGEGLGALGLPSPGPPSVAPLADADWAAAWRDHFRPLPVGRRLVIAPPWDAPALAGRLTVVIEPGRAFGTGHHGTTAGCLEALEALVEQGVPAHAIDLGTGSGILAVAAACLGVERVVAVDEDPDAVAAAIANAARNGVTDRVRCAVADVGGLDTAAAPLVLANLLSAAHARLAPRYAEYVAPGGALVLGGILDHEAAGVARALARHGFVSRATLSLDGWTTLHLARGH
ncbi:MAG TPA: 50S ribosomal protein L11 methyltransferase [Methylomirabilota bacterium]|nr:50S ribosomal protein L11 methyltransferase [Methylomirabilota bacterium]